MKARPVTAARQRVLTLEQTLRETAQAKWQGRRCYATNMSQAAQAIGSIAYEAGLFARDVTAEHATPDALRRVTAGWYRQGLSPATINKRLNCLSAMGVSVEGCRVREPKVLKWWLKPEDEAAALKYLRMRGPYDMAKAADAADLIEWTTRTGLRIEESLRLTWAELSLHEGTVTVPGLKTATAQATLPLGSEALDILRRRAAPCFRRTDDSRVFLLGYDELLAVWNHLRERQGWPEGATLKALRRSAARHLHITKGMPLDMVRQYLRHEDIETTLGYLRLTGGYGTEEMRKWL